MEFQKSEYFQKRAHKFYPSISRGSRLLKRGFRPLKSTQSSLSLDFCCLSISLRPRCISTASRFSTASLYLYCLAILYGLAVFVRCHISIFIFHRTPARKFPERLFSPSQHPPESFLTTPPEISRFPFGTKVIKILDLSLYLPPTRPFAVSPTLSYSTKPVFPIPQNQSFTNHATRQNPLLSFINLLARLSSSHPALQQHSSVQFITSYNYQVRFPDSSPCTVLLPIPQNQSFTNHATRQNPLLSFINRLPRSILISPCLTTTLISPVHHFPQLPSSLSRQFTMHCSPSVWQFRTRRAGNCTEFEAVSTYVTLKK